MPIELYIFNAAAISIFVPTPSVQLIRIGFLYLLGIVDAAANPPIDPIISFLKEVLARGFMISTN